VLLPNHQGEITEGSLSNLFLVDAADRVLTPGVDCGLLPGITRRLVLDLAGEAGLEPQEARVLPQDLYTAREAWLTARTIEILPIRSVDDRPIGSGRPGPITRRLQEAYRRHVQAWLAG
jgi:branched-subunit amino acid aminotransferase/4-amino-4-deoxychorismate lyase